MSKRQKRRLQQPEHQIEQYANQTYKPKLVFSRWVNRLIEKIHKHNTRKWKEWSAYMRLLPIEGWYKCVDLSFPKQTNIVAHTEITEKWKSEFISMIVEEYPEQMNEWFWWLHSHHWMQPNRSWEDNATRDSFWLQSDAWLSVVTSHKSWPNKCWDVYYRWTFDIYNPIRIEFDVDISVEDIPEEYETQQDSILSDYEEKLAENMKHIDEKIEEIKNKPYSIESEEQEAHIRMLLNAPDDVSFGWMSWSQRHKKIMIDKLEWARWAIEDSLWRKAEEALEAIMDIVDTEDSVFDLKSYIDDLSEAEKEEKKIYQFWSQPTLWWDWRPKYKRKYINWRYVRVMEEDEDDEDFDWFDDLHRSHLL